MQRIYTTIHVLEPIMAENVNPQGSLGDPIDTVAVHSRSLVISE